jgi:hypothetical protein
MLTIFILTFEWSQVIYKSVSIDQRSQIVSIQSIAAREVTTMKRTPGSPEKRTLSVLDRLVGRVAVRAFIDAAARRLERRLLAEPGAPMAWETVPLSLFDAGLPETIRSGWVFILRAYATTGAERHPNSHQRTLSYIGRGDLQTMKNGRWTSHPLVSDPEAPPGKRWTSIPANTWHQAVVCGGNWVVVSFHTVPAEQLIEERPRRDDPRANLRRLYVGEPWKA